MTKTNPKTQSNNQEMWLAQYIARAGICSRRQAIELIKNKEVKVNNKVIDNPATKINPDKDIIEYKKQQLNLDNTRLWLFHKPKACITSNTDPENRPTIFSFLPKELPRVMTVGRLDFNTEGLLLLTNNGKFAQYLESPNNNIIRTYRVRAYGKPIAKEQIMALEMGITIEGIKYKPVEIELEKIVSNNCWYIVKITEGKNREIRKIFQHVNMEVNRLIRVSFGDFKLGNIKSGGCKEIVGKKLEQMLEGINL